MHQEVTLFIGMFTTLLAIINPLEALPVFLKLLEGKDDAYHRRVARRYKIAASRLRTPREVWRRRLRWQLCSHTLPTTHEYGPINIE